MRRNLIVVAVMTASARTRADEGRFDAAAFTAHVPTYAHDLVDQSASSTIGKYAVLIAAQTDVATRPITDVDAQLRLTVLSGFGLTSWAHVAVTAPFQIAESPAVGDLRLWTKLMVPNPDRRRTGFAVEGFLSLPTGDPSVFAGEGTTTGGLTLIADHRFVGLFVALNAGLWLRQSRDWGAIHVGDMLSFGAAAETRLDKAGWFTMVGEINGAVSLDDAPVRQAPIETLLSIRWRAPSGLAVSGGAGVGRGYGFGGMGRLFLSIMWLPTRRIEQQQIERIVTHDPLDPDHDGLIGAADHCPNVPGQGDNDGCPELFLNVQFAPDKDVLLPESLKALDEAALSLASSPRARIVVEVHGHYGDAQWRLWLSERRARAIVRYLVEERGLSVANIEARGSTDDDGRIVARIVGFAP